MQFLNKNLKILPDAWRTGRRFATRPTGPEIRRRFVDYFTEEHQHRLVRSSPVVPFCDPTVAFVNAGMNQFKGVFLGTREPRHRRVANTQKCVRVGGKHNDLSVVGTDGYHHTFFEMMGNWSFGDYFKREACEMAWRLLTERYHIDPQRLYVTYFGGDERLDLAADLETREMWLQLGVAAERILPFGASDNFWEMGATGPCGPCTEIHYDHLGAASGGSVAVRGAAVNTGLPDLTEIWNLVFIQYNRQADGSISELPQKHVDTGMGLERLVAVLQGQSSNYATDLFAPIFEQIHAVSKRPKYVDCYDRRAAGYQLNTDYRILADHSRMITACLADGMFPDQNHKLRRVVRKAFALAERTFGAPDLLQTTTVPATVGILGDAYPEMQRSLPRIQEILRHEHEVYRALIAETSSDVGQILAGNPALEEHDVIEAAGFVPAYRELQSLRTQFKDGKMPGDVMFKFYDTYGLREETIERLAEIEHLQLDQEGFAQRMLETRSRTKSSFADAASHIAQVDSGICLDGLAYTENELKYNYRFNFATREYYSPRVRVQVLAVHSLGSAMCDVVLDQSTFYPEGGGQESDCGQLVKEKNKLTSSARVDHVRMGRGNVVVHRVQLPEPDWLQVGDMVEVVQESKRRTACTLHHTATHLLNACVRHVTRSVCYQRSSAVSADGLKLEMCVLGRKIDADVVQQVQHMIGGIIRTGIPIQTRQIDAQDFYAVDNITCIPGEVYPDRNIRLLTIEHAQHGGQISCEPCCGTHALNTRELEHFCITQVRHTGRGAYAFAAVAGRAAMASNELGDMVLRDIAVLRASPPPAQSARILQRLRQLVGIGSTDRNGHNDGAVAVVELPYLVRVECQQILADVAKAKREMTKDSMREFVEADISKLLRRISSDPNQPDYLVHALPETSSTEPVPLQRATKMCTGRPMIVISRTTGDGSVRARCTVPRTAVTERFGASQWLQQFVAVFGGQLAEVQKGQRPEEVAVMKAHKVPADVYSFLLSKSVQVAEDFAECNYNVAVESSTDQMTESLAKMSTESRQAVSNAAEPIKE